MKKQLAASFFLISFPIFLASCVSSLLKEAPPTFSKEIKVTAPQDPFNKMGSEIYPAWRNKTTGNVISIISECNSESLPSLQVLHQSIEGSVESFKLIKEQKVTFKNKPALVRNSEGELDGEPIEIQSMSFKRKNCGYVSSLTGKKNNLEKDRKAFQHFNESLSFNE